MNSRTALRGVVLSFTLTAAALAPSASAHAQETAPAAAAPEAEVAPAPAATSDAAKPADAVKYGIALRLPRFVSVPGWLLGLFTAENVPLATFKSYGAEFFRRKGDFDIVFGLNYQNMSPDDGNWLGKNKDPSLDTDLVQPRGMALLGVDVAFINRKMFNQYVGMHYGAGLGLALVRGEVLRTSNSSACTAANAGDERACRPRVCPPTGCTESILAATEGAPDGGPDDPHRFKDQNIPGALPILNLTLGADLRLPELPGFEARLEGGFYNAFFVGLGIGYVFL